MSAPREDVLERNLAALFSRAYVPVVPSAAFRARLERELAPWIAGERVRRPSLAPWLAAAGLLAAGLVGWRAIGGRASDPYEGRTPAPESLLVMQGDVALRELPSDAWRAASPDELRDGVAVSAVGSALEFFTPSERGFALSDGAGFEVRIPTWSWGRFEHGADASEVRLHYFDGEAEARSVARTALLRTEEGEVRLRDAAVRVSADFVGAVSEYPVLVHVLEGRASLDAGNGAIELEAPRRARMANGVVTVLDDPSAGVESLDREPSRESLPAPEPAEPRADAAEAPVEPPSPLATLTGTVVDTATDAPVSCFEITLLRAVDLPRVAWPESRGFEDANGRFAWDALEPGTYTVFVRADEHAMWKASSVALGPGASVELAVPLERGATLRGYVVDRETALPIAGALVVSETDAPVQVLPLDAALLPDELRARAITAADGSFEIAHVASGAQLLRANGPEHGQARTRGLVLREGELADGLLFELDPGGAVEGRVEREGGRPWAGARVIASEYIAQTGVPMTFGTALTDEEGRYRIEALAPGSYVMLVAPEDEESESFSPDISAVRIVRGETVRADFLRSTGKARLFGRVLDAGGAPLEGSTINLTLVGSDSLVDWRAATVDARGAYVLDDLEPGEYFVHAATGNGFVLQGRIRLSAGEALERDFRIVGSRMWGAITDAESGLPVEGCTLLLVPHVEPNGAEQFPALDLLVGKSWPGGPSRFDFPFVPPGRYDLVAIPADSTHAWKIVQDLAIDEGRDARVDLALLRGGSLSLRIVDEAGAPIEGARIELVDPHGRRIDALGETTRADGRAGLVGLEAGRWRVRASADGFAAAELALTIDAGSARDELVVLHP